MRQHDFEELAVEPLRTGLDLAEIETGLDVEIVGAGPVLEIEIDEAGRGLSAGAAVKQKYGGLHRERRRTGAAYGGQEGEDLRVRRLLVGGIFRDPCTSANEFDRRHRLDHEIGHPHLHQAAGKGALEAPRDHNDRRPITDAHHQAFESQQFGIGGGIEIDDDDACVADVDVAVLRQRSPDDIENGLRVGAE